jgi:hypothetical protein
MMGHVDYWVLARTLVLIGISMLFVWQGVLKAEAYYPFGGPRMHKLKGRLVSLFVALVFAALAVLSWKR